MVKEHKRRAIGVYVVLVVALLACELLVRSECLLEAVRYGLQVSPHVEYGARGLHYIEYYVV